MEAGHIWEHPMAGTLAVVRVEYPDDLHVLVYAVDLQAATDDDGNVDWSPDQRYVRPYLLHGIDIIHHRVGWFG